MKDSPGLHLKTYVLILFIAFFAPLGNVLLSKGMKTIGSARNWELKQLLHICIQILASGYIWLGIACLLAFFVAYMLGGLYVATAVLMAAMLINVFLLPTLYVWVARDHDVLPSADAEFDESE